MKKIKIRNAEILTCRSDRATIQFYVKNKNGDIKAAYLKFFGDAHYFSTYVNKNDRSCCDVEFVVLESRYKDIKYMIDSVKVQRANNLQTHEFMIHRVLPPF